MRLAEEAVAGAIHCDGETLEEEEPLQEQGHELSLNPLSL